MFRLCCAACGHIFIETGSIFKFNLYKDNALSKTCEKCGRKLSMINKHIEVTERQGNA